MYFIFVSLHALSYSDDVDGDIKAPLDTSSDESGSTTVVKQKSIELPFPYFHFLVSISHFLVAL